MTAFSLKGAVKTGAPNEWAVERGDAFAPRH